MTASDRPIAQLRVRQAGLDDHDAVADFAFEYLVWAIERLRAEYGVEWPPVTRDAVRASVAEYWEHGLVFLAERGEQPVGMGALRRLDDGSAEIKRMYVREGARGSGAGSALLDRLITAARDIGAETIKLDTVRFMADAQRLYRSRGFVERTRYAGSEIPSELADHWLFFERPVAM